MYLQRDLFIDMKCVCVLETGPERKDLIKKKKC